MNWIEFNPKSKDLPIERRCVLVQLSKYTDDYGSYPASVCVGYLRKMSDVFFVTIGIKQTGRTVTHYCDCLGDDFNAPGWANKKMNLEINQ